MRKYRDKRAGKGIVPRQFDLPEITVPVFAAMAMLVREGYSPLKALEILLAAEDQWPAMSDARRGKMRDAQAVLDVVYEPPPEPLENTGADCPPSSKSATTGVTGIQQLAEAQEQVAAFSAKNSELEATCAEQAEKIDQLYAEYTDWREKAEKADQLLSAANRDLDRIAPLKRLDFLTDGRVHKLADLHEEDGYQLDDAWLITGGIEERHVGLVRDFMKILVEPSPSKRFTRAGMLAFHGKEQPLERHPVYTDWTTPVCDLIPDFSGWHGPAEPECDRTRLYS